MSIVFSVLMFLLRIAMKIFFFCGLYIPVIVFLICLFICEKQLLPLWATNWMDDNVMVIMGISLFFSALTTIRNIIRIVTGNSDFKLSDLRRGSRQKVKEKNATDPVIKELWHDNGFIFGKQKGKFLAKSENEDGHILVIGGAGSGKSSCLAIPTLNEWKASVFAIDIKGELLAKCKRDKGKIKVFDPLDTYALGYDPFWALHESDNLAQDVKDITLAIIPLPPDTKDPFWIESAQNALNGSLLHFYALGYTFIESMRKIASTPLKTLLIDIMDSENELAKIFIAQLVDQKDETLAGIATELSNKIMLFATDPTIVNALSRKETVNPKQLEQGLDIFIQIPEHKIEQWKSLLTLINNQFLKYFEKRNEMTAEPILFLLDEFARLGKIDAILNGLATLRSKKITIAILTQSLAQLDLIYNKESRQVICDNCSYKAILKATDADTQEYFSKLVGTYDKEKKSTSANFEQYTQMGKGTGTSKTTEDKRIIKPEEFATLDRLVLLTPFGFCRADKTPYYKEKRWN